MTSRYHVVYHYPKHHILGEKAAHNTSLMLENYDEGTKILMVFGFHILGQEQMVIRYRAIMHYPG